MQALRISSVARIVAVIGATAVLTCLFCLHLQADSSSSRVPTGSSAIDRRYAPPLACMKFLPDGARVLVTRRPVVGVWFSHKYLYIEEADRSCGVKVVYGSYTPSRNLRRGNLASFQGVMGTLDNECVIYAQSPIECDDYAESGEIGPVAMSAQSIMGWPLPPRTEDAPRVNGLLPLGDYIKIWGRVTSPCLADDEGYFIYIDDGWGLKDKSGLDVKGVRVYSNARPDVGSFLIATGVLTNQVVYDPTPYGPSGDEVIVPVVQCSADQDPSFETLAPVSCVTGPVTGRVRLVGQGPPGEPVRVYCENGTIMLDNVTDDYTPYTLNGFPSQGCPVSASAPGFISYTRIAKTGDAGVDFELQPAERCIDISSDRDTVPVCSSASALISVMLRDSEGKPFHSCSMKLTTTRGVFVENGARTLVATTDEQGQIHAHLGAGSDGPGMAVVTASTNPESAIASSTQVQLKGPDITITANPLYLTQAGTSGVSAQLVGEDGPMPGAGLTFRTDHGTFQETGAATYQCLTDSQGNARATLQIDTPGTAIVTASYTDACSHHVVNWAVVAYKGQPWYSAGILGSSPLVVDLDKQDSGKKEVVLLTGEGALVALSSTGSLVWSRPLQSPGTNTPSCIALDSGPSAKPCVFVPSDTQQKVYGFSYDGKPLAGWPAGTNYRFLTVAAPIGDVNRDGSPEIVCGDQSCYVFSWNPTGDWKKSGTWDSSFLWRNVTAGPGITISNSTCALGDLDNDANGMLDVAMGSNYSDPMFAFPGDLWGDFGYIPAYTPGFPKTIEKLAQSSNAILSSPAIGDIDGDGLNDFAVGCDDGNLYIWLSSDGSWKGYPTGGCVRSSPALYDLDGDGKLDVIVGSDSGRLFAFNWQGQAPEGWAHGIRLNSSDIYPIKSSPVLGDVNGDGIPEIVVGCNDGNIYAVYKDGTNHVENGVATVPIVWVRCCIPATSQSAQVVSSCAIDDLDADGKVEVVAPSSEGIFVFRFDAPYTGNAAQFPWPTFHRDNQRTGCTTTPPAPIYSSIQGYVRKNGVGVLDAQVYITHNDGSTVYVPNSDPPVARSYVLTVGTTDPDQSRQGAFCINQLPANGTYKLTVEAPGETTKTVSGIVVTTGLVRVNVDL